MRTHNRIASRIAAVVLINITTNHMYSCMDSTLFLTFIYSPTESSLLVQCVGLSSFLFIPRCMPPLTTKRPEMAEDDTQIRGCKRERSPSPCSRPGCTKRSEYGDNFGVCSACHIRYCDKTCQRKDWRNHQYAHSLILDYPSISAVRRERC